LRKVLILLLTAAVLWVSGCVTSSPPPNRLGYCHTEPQYCGPGP